jgi:hypothetical protein
MFRVVVLILILIAGFVWLTKVQPVFATSSSAPLFSFSLEPLTASAIASERDTAPPFNGVGVVFIDTSAGAPGVPYISYETPKHQFGTKTLIFNATTDDPCQVSAGELPCARDIMENDPSASDASPIPSGSVVYLTGQVDEQAVIVDSYDVVSNIPSGMHLISIPFNSTGSIPSAARSGISITPLSVMDDASCTLGVGCFGNGVNRLSMTVSAGKSKTSTELVPGTTFVYGGSTIVLLSINGTGNNQSANFLIADNI